MPSKKFNSKSKKLSKKEDKLLRKAFDKPRRSIPDPNTIHSTKPTITGGSKDETLRSSPILPESLHQKLQEANTNWVVMFSIPPMRFIISGTRCGSKVEIAIEHERSADMGLGSCQCPHLTIPDWFGDIAQELLDEFGESHRIRAHCGAKCLMSTSVSGTSSGSKVKGCYECAECL